MQFSLSTFPHRRLRVLVLAVLSAALLVAPFSQAQAVPVWQVGTVDSAGDVGQYTSLALDASGFPVISYYEAIDATTGRLKLMHCNDILCSGNNESIVTVDGTGAAGTSVGTYTSLVLDANGFPVISYRDVTNTNLKLAHCNDVNCAGNNESIVTIDGAGGFNVGQYNSLTLDASGFPVISYQDGGTFDLKLVHCNDANCVGSNESIVTVVSAGAVGQYTSLKLYNGNPVISYYDIFDATNLDPSATGNLKLVRCDDPNCAGGNDVPQLLDGATTDVGQYTSLALDAGKAVVSYRANVGDLYLARCNDVACTTNTVQLVDSVGSTGSYSSLKLTAAGLPVISYRNATAGYLRLAKCSTVDCSGAKDVQTVDGTGSVGEYTSLALDAAGLPVVSYRDANVANLDLKLARQVDGSNVAPVANDQPSVTTPEDTAVNITLTATDANGDPLTYTIVTPPAHGTVSVGTGAARTYTPAANYFGADSFTFKANDGTLDSNVATVTINVTAVNDAPLANSQNVTTAEDTALNITLTASDVEGNPLTYSIVAQPAHGTLSGTAPNVTYTPAANYFGADSFTFKANDGTADSNVATVTINVTAVNDAPVADNQSVSTPEDTALNIILTAADVEGNPLTYSIVAQPAHGTLSGNAPNVTYTPAANYAGTDSFTFKANDGTADSNVATVSINVTAVNDAPVADDKSASTAEGLPVNITLTGSDVDGDPLSYSIVTGPTHGVLSGNGAVVTYTPIAGYIGSDSFTFQATDGQVDSNVATVTINVGAANNAPVADDQSVTTSEDAAVNITLTASDADNNPLSYSVVAQPTHGTLSGTAPNVTYTPAANYSGADSFTFKANDGLADSNVATVTIVVNAVNDTPVANNQTVTTAEDTSVNITLTASDVDGDALTYEVVTPPQHGTLQGGGSALTYTPSPNFFGTDTFTFKANDGQVDSNLATVTIQVSAVNDAPVASNQTVAAVSGQPVNITLGASDAEGSALTYTVVAEPQHGTLTGSGANLVYTPAANFTGTDQLTFRASDGQATSNVATVTFQVTAGPGGTGSKNVYLPLVKP